VNLATAPYHLHENQDRLDRGSDTGKTCICNRLETGSYNENPEPTVGTLPAKVEVSSEDRVRYIVGLWDTTGQSQFRTIVLMFFKNANFILAVFAVNSRAAPSEDGIFPSQACHEGSTGTSPFQSGSGEKTPCTNLMACLQT
jgi:hypothetical protein